MKNIAHLTQENHPHLPSHLLMVRETSNGLTTPLNTKILYLVIYEFLLTNQASEPSPTPLLPNPAIFDVILDLAWGQAG